MSSKTIMVIEDDPDTLRLLEVALKKFNYKVIAADSGVDALKVVREKRPDLVLLDVMMPEKSGYDVCAEIRADSDVCETPIFMVSAKVFEDDIKKGIHVGANDYITKPFDPFALVDRIAKFLLLTDKK